MIVQSLKKTIFVHASVSWNMWNWAAPHDHWFAVQTWQITLMITWGPPWFKKLSHPSLFAGWCTLIISWLNNAWSICLLPKSLFTCRICITLQEADVGTPQQSHQDDEYHRSARRQQHGCLANRPTSRSHNGGPPLITWRIILGIISLVGGLEHFSIYWEFHNPNGRSHIFQRGRLQPPTRSGQ